MSTGRHPGARKKSKFQPPRSALTARREGKTPGCFNTIKKFTRRKASSREELFEEEGLFRRDFKERENPFEGLRRVGEEQQIGGGKFRKRSGP